MTYKPKVFDIRTGETREMDITPRALAVADSSDVVAFSEQLKDADGNWTNEIVTTGIFLGMLEDAE